jgi:CheY-like chemotaxis protein
MIFTSSRAQSKRTYDEDDLRLAEELARRAAMALDNARLFRELRDQDDRKDRFLATLAHELRNPLAALQHALDILEMPDTDETGRRRALDVAERQVRHQTRLVEDLLDVARLNKGAVTLRRETVDAAPIVEDAAEIHRPFAEKRGQTLTVRVHGGAEIVGNLIDNAIKYSPRDTPIEVLVDKEDGAVRIEVSDEGPGIPEDLRWNVFDAFVQGERTHEMPSAGLGIGLTIVRQLVELHGGAVELRSGSDGRGTTVVVTLPGVASADRQPRRVTPRETPVPLRVLVVDDNADAADMLASLLSAWGHRARAVYDGRAAVDAAKQDDPDIALIDIGMPDMDGYETARAMRHEAGSSARLVALTGYAQPSDVAAALEAGFDRHVAKPVDAKTLRKLLVERSEPG